MASVQYLGPSDVFAVGGKEYRRGDAIPLSADAVRHHMRAGHRFDVQLDGTTQPATLKDADTERGEVPKSVTDASGSVPVAARQRTQKKAKAADKPA